jgi:ABC-type antimicrobial peptide transport system permease subunit
MLAIAGAMALLIGVVGIYGVMAYAVSQRRREIGIRMALGAQPRNVARMFILNGMLLALVGIASGLVVAAILTRVLVSSLYGVSPLDPLTFAAVSLGLIATAVIASYIPALRAMRVDPLEPLRVE